MNYQWDMNAKLQRLLRRVWRGVWSPWTAVIVPLIVVSMLGSLEPDPPSTWLAAGLTLAVGLSLVIGALSWPSHAPVRSRVVALLLLFVGIVTVYGAAYSILFRLNPLAFSFNTSLEEGMAFEQTNETLHRVDEEAKLIYYIGIVQESPSLVLENGKVARAVDLAVADAHMRFEIFVGHGGVPPMPLMFLTTPDGEYRAHELSGTVGQAVGDVIDASGEAALQKNLNKLVSAIGAVRHGDLLKLRREIGSRPEWSVLDFLYFSTITMTTIGYGDVLPNSTWTRFLVMTESLLGVFVVAFALLVLWPGGRGAKMTSPDGGSGTDQE